MPASFEVSLYARLNRLIPCDPSQYNSGAGIRIVCAIEEAISLRDVREFYDQLASFFSFPLQSPKVFRAFLKNTVALCSRSLRFTLQVNRR